MNFKILKKSKFEDVAQQAKEFQHQNADAIDFLMELEKGNLKANLPKKLLGSELGTSLESFQKHLIKIDAEEQIRKWTNEGLSKFSDLLRNQNSLNLKDLANEILSSLVKHLNINQGAIFILEGNEGSEQYLKMLSCYAYDRRKFMDQKIDLDEGLTGQCIKEKEPIYLTEVPNDFVNISSGLGEANPNAIYISPLLINDSAFGVLELASFEKIDQSKIDFINKLSENIAGTIKSVKDSEQTKTLLRESQQQAEELRAQEEEMRQNMEELQATQEEMSRKGNELSKAMAETEGLIDGINATMATIEFTPDGIVKTANDNFLKSMKVSLVDIKGKHHQQFVPQDIADSNEYKTFWKRLAEGESMTGIFRRINAEGNIVWLNAIYNPIQNENGEVTKVVKFATDITNQQETLAESKGILNGVNATMATIEFSPEGYVVTANDNFLKTMKVELENITGKHHKQFVSQDIADSDEYKKFWKRLATGEAISGIFQRIDSEGNTVWLNAIYNPIRNANNEVIKVVKFATDITEQQEAIAESKGVLNGVNATMATIEFTPDGIVLTANDNFLKTMNVQKSDIVGKHHRQFVPSDMVNTKEYLDFWKQLAEGKSTTGIFRRVDAKGNTVWLNAIYNPIRNANNEVIKVVKFATDVTEQQELLLQKKAG